MTGKQLKNSILQWAIQGKLVPQDPNDEPASVLLEKIREEKALLIKEGKIKKDKKESIIYRGDDNKYFEKKDRILSALMRRYLLRYQTHGYGFVWKIFVSTYNEGNHPNIHPSRNIQLLLRNVINGAVSLLKRHNLSYQKPFQVMEKSGNCKIKIYYGTQQDLERLGEWLYTIQNSILTS